MLEIVYKCPSFSKVLVNARKYFIFWNLVMWKCILVKMICLNFHALMFLSTNHV